MNFKSKDLTSQETKDRLRDEIVAKNEEFNTLALQFVQAVRQLGYNATAVMAVLPEPNPDEIVLSSSYNGDPRTQARMIIAFLNSHPEIKLHFMMLEVINTASNLRREKGL